MLQNQKPDIDLSKLPDNVLSVSQQLLDKAIAYKHRCLIVLDPFLSSIDDHVINYFYDLNCVHQIKIMHSSILANKRPLLLELDLTDVFHQQALRYIVHQALIQLSPRYLSSGNRQQYCAWLFTQSSVNKIANDLAKLALQKCYNNKTLWLRFYDPAIFPQLMSVLTLFQQAKLYGDIESWAMLNGNHELVFYQHLTTPKPILSGQLAMTVEQLTQLYCIGINNQIINKQRMMNSTDNIDDITSLKRITPSVLRLLDKNINDEQLMIEWGKLALKFGPNFDLSPLIQNKIEKLTTSQQYYAVLNDLYTLNSCDFG